MCHIPVNQDEAAIGVYDTLLTLPREVQCIWSMKPSMVTVVYVCARYGTLLVGISVMINPVNDVVRTSSRVFTISYSRTSKTVK